MNESTSILKMTLAALEDLKALEVRTLDVGKLTTITDAMVIASGRSNRHVKSLAEEVIKQAKTAKVEVIGIEGENEGEWVLVDLAYVIVHIMLPKVRDFYQLEKLWNMGDDEVQQNQT